MTVLEEITRSSMQGYIDDTKETEQILDKLMQCRVCDYNKALSKDDPDKTVLSMIKELYYCTTGEDLEEDEFLDVFIVLDHIMNAPAAAAPWARLLSAVTVETLFNIYYKRSTCNVSYSAWFSDAAALIKRCTGEALNGKTTVGQVLKAARTKRRRAWSPNEDIKEYASKIRDSYRVIKTVLYDGIVDIYNVKALYERDHLNIDDGAAELCNEKIA